MISTRSDACRHLSMMEYAIDRSVVTRKDFQPMYFWQQEICWLAATDMHKAHV